MSRKKNQQARRAALEQQSPAQPATPPPPATAPTVGDPVLALLQQIALGQQEMKQDLGELRGDLENLNSRVGAIEVRGPGTTNHSGGGAGGGEGYGAALAGNLLDEPEDGIPDKYYRNQHIVIQGRRTKQEVIETREKLNEAAQKEAVIWQQRAGLWGPNGERL